MLVLVDADAASWSSWNRYGEQFAADTGARVMRTDDGGVTGPTFFEHVRELRRPAHQPKGQDVPLPGDSVRRPAVVAPVPLWTWSLVWRRDEDSAAVRVSSTRSRVVSATSVSVTPGVVACRRPGIAIAATAASSTTSAPAASAVRNPLCTNGATASGPMIRPAIARAQQRDGARELQEPALPPVSVC